MASVFTAAAFVPSPPLLVPELSGGADAALAALRAAVLDVGARLAGQATRWIVVGAAQGSDPGGVVEPGQIGTFRGFGADVRVSLAPEADAPTDSADDGRVHPQWPLAALIAAWIRQQSAPHVRAQVVVLDEQCTSETALAVGVRLRGELDEVQEPTALLVVADGARTLTDRAPGAFDERSAAVQNTIDDALGRGDRAVLASLDPQLCRDVGVSGRAPWQVLVGAFSADPAETLSLYCDAPYGVGYHVGMWLP